MDRTTEQETKEGIQTDSGSTDSKVFVYLAERALHGDGGCLQNLVDSRNDKWRDESLEMDRNGFSQAAAWSSEPEWHGESSEAVSETAAGSREPEGDAV